jgi:hypothetical protein
MATVPYAKASTSFGYRTFAVEDQVILVEAL